MGTRTVRAREGWNPKQVPRTEVEMMVQDFSQCFVCCLLRHLRLQQRQQRIPDSQLGHSSVTLCLTHNTSSNTPGAPAATQPEFHLKQISCLQNPPICFSGTKPPSLYIPHTPRCWHAPNPASSCAAAPADCCNSCTRCPGAAHAPAGLQGSSSPLHCLAWNTPSAQVALKEPK